VVFFGDFLQPGKEKRKGAKGTKDFLGEKMGTLEVATL
jgi:hypothetical protein